MSFPSLIFTIPTINANEIKIFLIGFVIKPNSPLKIINIGNTNMIVIGIRIINVNQLEFVSGSMIESCSNSEVTLPKIVKPITNNIATPINPMINIIDRAMILKLESPETTTTFFLRLGGLGFLT